MKSLTGDQYVVPNVHVEEKKKKYLWTNFYQNIYQNAQISQYFRFFHGDVHALKPPSKRATTI